MVSAAVEALTQLLAPETLSWLVLGVLVGLLVGLLPGFGGISGMALLLPFVYGMDQTTGVALLIGMVAGTGMGDTFTAILVGVPGSAQSAATVVDGYPMARRGEAGRALGASFGASFLGAVFGALVLLAVVPIARPLVLSLGSPELFMLTLLGLSMVAVLSQGSPVKGLAAGFLGMLLSTVGLPPAVPGLRFDFGIEYLVDGISLTAIAIGVFGIPELINIIVENKRIARDGASSSGGMRQGLRDVINNKRVVLQGSVLGTVLGALPGIGGAVIDWIAYGLAARTVRKNNRFGSGDVRGVIAPEAATAAKEGGSLLPTLLFGIPGGALMAVLLGGFTLLGIQPGPDMVDEAHRSLLLAIVWTLLLGSMIGGAICILLVTPVAKLAQMPSRWFAPVLCVIMLLAGYQTNESWGDVVVILVLGVAAYLMKLAGWPRVPMLVGFVLGTGAERYLTISMSRFGTSWMTNWLVIVMGLLCVIFIAMGIRQGDRNITQKTSMQPSGEEAAAAGRFVPTEGATTDVAVRQRLKPTAPTLVTRVLLAAVITVTAAGAYWVSQDFVKNARWFPQFVAAAAACLALMAVGREVVTAVRARRMTGEPDVDQQRQLSHGLLWIAILGLLAVGMYFVGFWIAAPVWLLAVMLRGAKISLPGALAVALLTTAGLVGISDLVDLEVPHGTILDINAN